MEDGSEGRLYSQLAVGTRHLPLSSSVFFEAKSPPCGAQTGLKLEMLLVPHSSRILGSWVCVAPSLCVEFSGKADHTETVAATNVLLPVGKLRARLFLVLL